MFYKGQSQLLVSPGSKVAICEFVSSKALGPPRGLGTPESASGLAPLSSPGWQERGGTHVGGDGGEAARADRRGLF